MIWPFKKAAITKMPPLCANCVFAESKERYSRCFSPRSRLQKTSPVDGSIEWSHCQTERTNYTHIAVCGIEGKWFVPKPFITDGAASTSERSGA